MNSSSNKMDPNFTGMWVSFFTAAGIPSDASVSYALTFTENRIQNDMLLDLNKEYLRDMGITTMGDVIAILRHAKQVHESTARDRVLSTTTVSKVPVAAVTGRSTLTQNKSSSSATPASRILEHYIRNSPMPETSPTNKRKLSELGSEVTVDAKKSRLIRFSSTQKVTPNDGTISKSAVFSRLGNSDAAVKTISTNNDRPIFARLGAKSNAISPIPKKKITPPVIPLSKDALKYEGILKSPPQVRKVFTVTTSTRDNNVRKIACTMRADEAPVSVKEKLDLPKAKSVKFSNQVQYKEIESNNSSAPSKITPVFNVPGRRLTMPDNTTNTVKSRLGTKKVNSLTITTSVFKRLGV